MAKKTKLQQPELLEGQVWLLPLLQRHLHMKLTPVGRMILAVIQGKVKYLPLYEQARPMLCAEPTRWCTVETFQRWRYECEAVCDHNPQQAAA